MARSASVTRLARSSMGRLERGYRSMRLISAMSLPLSGERRGHSLANDCLAQAVGTQQVLVRAKFMDEIVLEAERVQVASRPVVPGDLLDHCRQAAALGVFLNDNHRLELMQQPGDSRRIERLKSVYRHHSDRALMSRLETRCGVERHFHDRAVGQD